MHKTWVIFWEIKLYFICISKNEDFSGLCKYLIYLNNFFRWWFCFGPPGGVLLWGENTSFSCKESKETELESSSNQFFWSLEVLLSPLCLWRLFRLFLLDRVWRCRVWGRFGFPRIRLASISLRKSRGKESSLKSNMLFKVLLLFLDSLFESLEYNVWGAMASAMTLWDVSRRLEQSICLNILRALFISCNKRSFSCLCWL